MQAGQTMEGGDFVVANGKLTGLLIDNAVGVVERNVPAATKEDYKNWLTAAQKLFCNWINDDYRLWIKS